MTRSSFLLILLLAGTGAVTPAAQVKQLVGTVSAFLPDAAELAVKLDDGATVRVKITPATLVQRIAAGEKDLKNAAPAAIGDIAAGDRVLVALLSGGEARRLLVMPFAGIAKKQAADRLDWQRRGLLGVVASKTDSSLTLKMRSLTGETTATVVVDGRTGFRRYAPDSVRYADARPSQLSEVQPGDQLRARGRKNEAGNRVEAEEVVFGSFITRAGIISAIEPGSQTLTLKDIGNKKPFVVKLTVDTQLKTMPQMAADPMRGFGPPMGGGPGLDIAQLLEHMPEARFVDLQPGMTIVVSSTKGASADQLTAIMLVANAEMLVQMAQRSAQANGNNPGVSLSGGGFGGLDLPGMIN